MKKSLFVLLGTLCSMGLSAKTKTVTPLSFDRAKGVKTQLTMPDGHSVSYTAYTQLYYVTHVEDSTSQVAVGVARQ